MGWSPSLRSILWWNGEWNMGNRGDRGRYQVPGMRCQVSGIRCKGWGGVCGDVLGLDWSSIGPWLDLYWSYFVLMFGVNGVVRGGIWAKWGLCKAWSAVLKTRTRKARKGRILQGKLRAYRMDIGWPKDDRRSVGGWVGDGRGRFLRIAILAEGFWNF